MAGHARPRCVDRALAGQARRTTGFVRNRSAARKSGNFALAIDTHLQQTWKMNHSKLPFLLTVILLAIAGICYGLVRMEPRFDLTTLLVADLIMYFLSMIAWAMLRKSVTERPQAFIRGVYGATLLRLFVCLIGILIYAMVNRDTVYKPTFFVLFGIYAAYAFTEAFIFSKVARKN